MRVQTALDLTQNELRNPLLQNLGADPTGLGAGAAGLFWFNTAASKLVKMWDGTAVQTLTNLVESISSGTTALTVTPTGKAFALTIAAANGSTAGLLSSTDYNLIHTAVSTSTPSSLVQRDGSGNFAAGTITAALTGTASNASALGNQTLAQVRDFAQTTGQRDHTAINDFDTQVRTTRHDQMAPATAPVAIGSQRLTGVADPTSAQDAATKNYVDNIATGLDIKASVRGGTIAALPANTYANGTSGVGATLTANANGAFPALDTTYTAALNDRVLVKNEATGANNGIYVLTQVGSGAAPWILTRATDADTAAKLTPGAFTFVESGQTLVGSGWVVNTVTNPIVIGSTAITWGQFSGGQAYTAGNGLNLAGSAFAVVGTTNRISVGAGGVDIAATYVGQTSITTLGTIATGVWNGTAVPVANGGTGATTAAGARTNLSAAGKASVNIPATGANTAYQFNHGLNTTDVHVQCADLSTGDVVFADFKVVDANNVSITFGAAVAANAYRLIVVG